MLLVNTIGMSSRGSKAKQVIQQLQKDSSLLMGCCVVHQMLVHKGHEGTQECFLCGESEESRWVVSCLSSGWEPKIKGRMVIQTRWICVEATKTPSSKTHLKQLKKWCDVH